MRHNPTHYQRALFLRKKKGYSYNEIRNELPVAKSTLSHWLHTIQLNETQRARLQRKQAEQGTRRYSVGAWNRDKRQKEIVAIREKAKKEIGKLTKRELLIAGVMLYWAEGNKVDKMVAISNADPLFISFIMQWFRQHLTITEDRFRISVHYHKGQKYAEIEKFWSEVTAVPFGQFRKPFCKPVGTGHRKHYLQWGVCRVHITRSADLLHQILAWKDSLISEVVFGKTVKQFLRS